MQKGYLGAGQNRWEPELEGAKTITAVLESFHFKFEKLGKDYGLNSIGESITECVCFIFKSFDFLCKKVRSPRNVQWSKVFYWLQQI